MNKLMYCLLFLVLAGPLAPLTGQSRRPAEPLKQLMFDKMKNAQLVLEGLAMADFAKIRRGGEDLIRLSKTAEWMVRKTPQYELQSNEFRRAAEVMVQKAREKNIDGVTLAYMDLVRSCVRCHEYVREVRDVRLPALHPDSAVAFHGQVR
jgi:hypothetical protein